MGSSAFRRNALAMTNEGGTTYTHSFTPVPAPRRSWAGWQTCRCESGLNPTSSLSTPRFGDVDAPSLHRFEVAECRYASPT